MGQRSSSTLRPWTSAQLPVLLRAKVHDDGSRSLDAWDRGLVVDRHNQLGSPEVIFFHEVQVVVREAKLPPEMMVLGMPTKNGWEDDLHTSLGAERSSILLCLWPRALPSQASCQKSRIPLSLFPLPPQPPRANRTQRPSNRALWPGSACSTQACFFTPATCSKYCFTAGIQDAKEASETTSGCAPGFLPAPPNICSANAGPRFGYKPNSKLVARVWKAHLDWAEGVEALEISASSGQVLVVLALI